MFQKVYRWFYRIYAEGLTGELHRKCQCFKIKRRGQKR